MDVYDFGIRIKELRQSKNLTQEQLAKILEIERATVSSYERDRIAPSAIVVKRAAQFFNVTTDYLLGATDVETISLEGFSKSGKQAVIRIISDMKNILNENNKTGD